MATQRPPTALDLNNIQGDILSGLPKKTETYFFFQVTNVKQFRTQFSRFVPLVKTVAQVLKDRDTIEKHKREDSDAGRKPHLVPLVGVNISFSHFGLQALGINDANLDDSAFQAGQLKDATLNLGDKAASDGTPDWEPAFKQQIHGLILVAGDSHQTVDKKLQEVQQIFGLGTPNASLREVTRVVGDVRPGAVSAHEHFGFLDGVSNPAIIDFDKNPAPGPAPIRAGAIITGRDGDAKKDKRDPWMVDGSFLVFRLLFQRVPEFDEFLIQNPIEMPGMSKAEGSELLGARMVGRWKSGAPIDLAPFEDDKDIANDPQRINNFRFAAERDFQKLCPFAAHVRKTLPRADLEDQGGGISLESRRIMRRGIQFGPEVTKQEQRSKKTQHGRGLLFACYQSSITSGFQFIQQSWANNQTFPPFETTPEVPGFDPIIGQGADRKLSGIDPNDPAKELQLPADPWVVPRGGEYFFAPSLKGLKETIALQV